MDQDLLSKFSPIPQIDLPNYTITSVLGRGSFGTVYMAYHSITKLNVAIKIFNKNSLLPNQEKLIRKEISIMQDVTMFYIIQLIEIIETDSVICIVMQLAKNGTLLQLISRVGRLRGNEAKTFFLQIISALEYLFTRYGIVHRDIKPDNILIGNRANILLSDFGLSNQISEENPLLSTAVGSPPYVSPEMIKRDKHDFKTDIWSTGVVLYCMVTGNLPFQGNNIGQLFQQILDEEPEYPDYLPEDLVDLLKHLLDKDPKTRYGFEEIYNHPWVSNLPTFISFIRYKSLNCQIAKNLAIKDTIKIVDIDPELLNEMINNHTMNSAITVYRLQLTAHIQDIFAKVNDILNAETLMGGNKTDEPFCEKLAKLIFKINENNCYDEFIKTNKSMVIGNNIQIRTNKKPLITRPQLDNNMSKYPKQIIIAPKAFSEPRRFSIKQPTVKVRRIQIMSPV